MSSVKRTDPDARAVEPAVPWARVRAADHIAGQLRRAIMSGELATGERLPAEKELATTYGVSVNTIREAIRALGALGLVEVRHGRGTYVTGLPDALVSRLFATVFEADQIRLESVVQLQHALLAQALTLAVDRASDEEIDHLKRLLEQVDGSSEASEIAAAGRQFRDDLVELGHDPLLTRLHRFARRLTFALAATFLDDAAWVDSHRRLQEERRKLLAALRSRDRQAVRSAVDDFNDAVDRVLVSHPEFTSLQPHDKRWSRLMNDLASG